MTETTISAEQFKQAFIPLNGELYRIAFHMMGNRDDALDAMQDLMLSLWQRREELSSVVSLKAMAIVSLRNLCYSRLRHLQLHNELMVDIPSDIAEEELPDTEHQIATARQLMQQLDEPARTLMRLRFDAELSTSEIATATGLSNANVRQILSRTLRNFRKIISR